AMHHVSMGVLMSRVGVAIAVGHVVVLVVVPDVVVADALLLLLVHPCPEAFLYPVAARAPRYLTCRWAEDEPLHTVLVDVVEAVTLNPVTAGQGARLGADRITDECPPLAVSIHVMPCVTDYPKLTDPVGHRSLRRRPLVRPDRRDAPPVCGVGVEDALHGDAAWADLAGRLDVAAGVKLDGLLLALSVDGNVVVVVIVQKAHHEVEHRLRLVTALATGLVKDLAFSLRTLGLQEVERTFGCLGTDENRRQSSTESPLRQRQVAGHGVVGGLLEGSDVLRADRV